VSPGRRGRPAHGAAGKGSGGKAGKRGGGASAPPVSGTGRLPARLLADLQARLDARANERSRSWWERYLRGSTPFRGVPMAAIRAELHAWLAAHALDGADAARQFDFAADLIRQPHTEDKLPGMLWYQEVLLPAGAVRWRPALRVWARLFDDGCIADWNACDWFCVRVLGPLAEREGEPCARAIAAWRRARDLWRRRAAGVAFINLAPKGDANRSAARKLPPGTVRTGASIGADSILTGPAGPGPALRFQAK